MARVVLNRLVFGVIILAFLVVPRIPEFQFMTSGRSGLCQGAAVLIIEILARFR
jgi:hypothetical protein